MFSQLSGICGSEPRGTQITRVFDRAVCFLSSAGAIGLGPGVVAQQFFVRTGCRNLAERRTEINTDACSQDHKNLRRQQQLSKVSVVYEDPSMRVYCA